MRQDERRLDVPRPVSFTLNYTKHAEGSALIDCGDTRVLCTASVEEKVPHFCRGTGRGWITSEYGMLPRSTGTRMTRESSKGRPSGRTQEIQRLIGRSLRSVVDLTLLGEKTVWVDCDVIQADGGTRTAAITGGFVALVLALGRQIQGGQLKKSPLLDFLAAVSVGIVDGQPCLDLAYAEDVRAEVDMNVVMTGADHYVEIQGTAEGKPFSPGDLERLLGLARTGIRQLIDHQRIALESQLEDLSKIFPETTSNRFAVPSGNQ